MTGMDPEKLGAALAPVVKSAIAKAIEPLKDRLTLVEAKANGVTVPIIDHVESELAPFKERIAHLEAVLRTVEERGVSYEGVYQRAQDYRRGAVVTHKGSAWVALDEGRKGEPGQDNCWQLMAKRGRDA
jgi:hypothetical protein